jgi:hypothetical protein
LQKPSAGKVIAMLKKRSFLLLEVLLAIALVAVFAAPLMRWPIQHYRSQMNRLEDFERRRIADWTFTEIKELLLKEAIPWDRLPSKDETARFSLPDAKMILPKLPPRLISRSYTLKCKGEKQGLHGETFRLFRVEVYLDSKKNYRYRILVQRLGDTKEH